MLDIFEFYVPQKIAQIEEKLSKKLRNCFDPLERFIGAECEGKMRFFVLPSLVSYLSQKREEHIERKYNRLCFSPLPSLLPFL